MEKIRKARNKNWAHSDLKTILNQEKFYSDLGLKWGEVEKVFFKLFETIEKLKKLFNEKDATDYIEYFQDIEKNCKKDLEDFMNYRIKKMKYDL